VHDSLGEALKEWHDFYLLIGTAAATLVGLTFVAVSAGAGAVTRDHEAGLRSFLTPTVADFTAILVACLILLAPFEDARGALLLVAAAVGAGYSVWVWARMRRHGFTATVDLADRAWYALAPLAGHLAIGGAAVAYLFATPASLAIIAGGLGLLLLAGIRNAWDMTLWYVMRPRN
jgi:hypothetical protein